VLERPRLDVVHERPRLGDNIQDTTHQETLLEHAIKGREDAEQTMAKAVMAQEHES
jgi:hypothetical protein